MMTAEAKESLASARAELIDSLRANNAEQAKRLLQKFDALRTEKDDCGRTAVHWAASGGCLEIVQFCVSLREEDAIAQDDMGWTPLMIASSAGRIEVVRFLIGLPYIEVNVRNKNKQTALHYAASKNQPQITSILLKNGADVNVRDNYQATPLHRAASQGHEKIIPILLAEPRIEIDLTDSTGSTALHLAVEEKREDVAIKLAECGANLELENKEKQTPLTLVHTGEMRRKLKAAAARHVARSQ